MVDTAAWDHNTIFCRTRAVTRRLRQPFSGFPLVDIRARFLIPSRFGDDVVVESGVSQFRRSSFDVQHRLRNAGELAVDCFETRVWISRHPDDRNEMQSQPVPLEVKERFGVG